MKTNTEMTNIQGGKSLKKTHLLMVLLILFVANNNFARTKITNGYILISGTEYNTSDYQTYLEFEFSGIRQNPRIKYDFLGSQDFSVYQDHPVRPNGFYRFSVKMPYSPSAIFINNTLVSPTWYSDSTWELTSSAQTPLVDKNSPEYINVEAPFQFKARMLIYGSASVTTRVRGAGTSDLLFQKIEGRYFLRQATYNFGKQ